MKDKTVKYRVLPIFILLMIIFVNTSCTGIYRVELGDNLTKIALRYNTTVKELVNLNGLKDDLLRVGQRLKVPDSQVNIHSNKPEGSTFGKASAKSLKNSISESVVVTPVKTTQPKKEIVFNVPRRIFIGYKVKSGDALLKLARRFDTSVKELKKINSLKADTIRIGQILRVPSYRMEEVRLSTEEMVIDTNCYSGTEPLDTRALELVFLAKEYEGTPYKRGGESPLRVDCSGFVRMLFKYFDIFLPHSSRAQFEIGEKVKTITIGDLVFFATRGARRVNHVGIYIGDEKFIHASSGKGKVVITSINSLYYKNRFHGARRVWSISKKEVSRE